MLSGDEVWVGGAAVEVLEAADRKKGREAEGGGAVIDESVCI